MPNFIAFPSPFCLISVQFLLLFCFGHFSTCGPLGWHLSAISGSISTIHAPSRAVGIIFPASSIGLAPESNLAGSGVDQRGPLIHSETNLGCSGVDQPGPLIHSRNQFGWQRSGSTGSLDPFRNQFGLQRSGSTGSLDPFPKPIWLAAEWINGVP